MNISNNWVYEHKTATEKDRKALEAAKKYEKNLEKNGYRWIDINSRNSLLVQCDENGKPTEQGQMCINKFKQHLGIK